MRDRIDIDHTHSSAISQEIGERLQAILADQPSPTPALNRKIEMLGRRDRQWPPIAALGKEIAKSRDRSTGKRGEWLRLLRWK